MTNNTPQYGIYKVRDNIEQPWDHMHWDSIHRSQYDINFAYKWCYIYNNFVYRGVYYIVKEYNCHYGDFLRLEIK